MFCLSFKEIMCYQWEITKMSRETQSNITKYATWTITVVTTSQLAESCPLYQNSSITTPVKTTWNWLCGYHYFVNTIVVQCYPEALLRFEISRFITQVHINSNVHINQTSSSQTRWDRGNILIYLKIWNTFVYHTG